MPDQPKQECNEIVPPVMILLLDSEEIEAFPSVEAAIMEVEPIDVLNGEYKFYDSTGRVLEGQVHKDKVDLVPTSKFEGDSPVLRAHIVHTLSIVGVSAAEVTGLPFSELSRVLLEKYGDGIDHDAWPENWIRRIKNWF